jgi:hypothetical protein
MVLLPPARCCVHADRRDGHPLREIIKWGLNRGPVVMMRLEQSATPWLLEKSRPPLRTTREMSPHANRRLALINVADWFMSVGRIS